MFCVKLKKVISKRTIWVYEQLPSTRHQILEFLYEFISQFLRGGYNVLMQSIREDIEKEHQEIQSSDAVVFFHVAQFVTSFQYYKSLTSKSCNVADKEVQVTTHDDVTLFDGCVCGPVSQTLNESMFLMVISKWRYAFEGLKQTNDYKLSFCSWIIGENYDTYARFGAQRVPRRFR